MKKLMIAAAIVCAAVATQAAEAKWNWQSTGKASKGNLITDWTGANLYSQQGGVTFYLFDAVAVSQSQVLTGLRSGEQSITDFANARTTTLTADSQIKEKAGEGEFFNYGNGGEYYSYWMAAVVDDKILISDTLDPLAGNPTSPNSIGFEKPGLWTINDKGTADWTAGGQGWYSVAAVPEPTSGLLLLLGVAGLALRRRRA